MTPPPDLINYPHVAQIFRVKRDAGMSKKDVTGEISIACAHGITSAPRERASPEDLLAWACGHPGR